jgi:hypothetical protein
VLWRFHGGRAARARRGATRHALRKTLRGCRPGGAAQACAPDAAGGGAGGNCYDFVGSHGIRVSQYGVHLFHTQARTPKKRTRVTRVASALLLRWWRRCRTR